MAKLGEIKIGTGASKVYGSEYSLMLDQRVVRYGQTSGKKPYINYRDESTGKQLRLYETKATAMLDVIETVRNIRMVGGHGKVNFSLLPDEVLEGIGFMKMPDIMGVGVPMWAGDPESIVRSDDWWDTAARERSVSNTESLLSIIQEVIRGKAA